MSTRFNDQLDQLTDEELNKLAKRGKQIYNKQYRERKKEAVKRAQQRSYAKIALAADAELEGGVEVE